MLEKSQEEYLCHPKVVILNRLSEGEEACEGCFIRARIEVPKDLARPFESCTPEMVQEWLDRKYF